MWPQNMPIVEAFLSVTSQLIAIGLAHGGLLWRGFDYAGVKAGLDAAGLSLLPHQWTGLRVMESAATSALNGYRG